MVVFEQGGCTRANVIVFGQKLLYLEKMVVLGQKWLFPCKVVVFRQGGCIRAKVVVLVKE